MSGALSQASIKKQAAILIILQFLILYFKFVRSSYASSCLLKQSFWLNRTEEKLVQQTKLFVNPGKSLTINKTQQI